MQNSNLGVYTKYSKDSVFMVYIDVLNNLLTINNDSPLGGSNNCFMTIELLLHDNRMTIV